MYMYMYVRFCSAAFSLTTRNLPDRIIPHLQADQLLELEDFYWKHLPQADNGYTVCKSCIGHIWQ